MVYGGSDIISSDSVQGGILFYLISRQAGMDGFFRVENALWTVRRRYVQGGILFSFIISQKAIPDFVLSWDK